MLTKLLCCDCRRRASIPNTVTKMMEKVCFVIGTWLHVLQKKFVKRVVPVLGGNLEIGEHLWSDIGYIICLRHLFRSRAFTNWIFSPKRPVFFFMCAVHVLSYHLINLPSLYRLTNWADMFAARN